MSRFLTTLKVECLDPDAVGGRGFWRLLAPLVYKSDLLEGRTIEVEAGFITDYASVPRLPIIYGLLGDCTHQSAVIHDWLFHHHEVCDEDLANKILLEAMEVEGVPWWRRKLIYFGVVIGGRSSWIEDAQGNGHTIVDGKIV